MDKFSTVTTRNNSEKKLIKIDTYINPELLENATKKWQKIIDDLTKTVNVPSGLIMRLNNDSIEVLIRSNTKGNPYKVGEKTALKKGLYCETVIGTKNKLIVPNALKSNLWKHNNPDVDINMISYIGFPICWPNGDIFGTICMLDNKENNYTIEIEKLLTNAKEIIESEVHIMLLDTRLHERNKKLNDLNQQLIEKSSIINTYNKSLTKQEKKEVYSNLPIAICTSVRGKINFMNKKFKKLTGYSIEETPNWRIWFVKIFPDESYREKAFKVFTNDIRNYRKNPSNLETRIYKITAKNGEEKRVRLTFNFLDETFIGSFIDVTKELENEKRIEENTKSYQSFFEGSKAIILMINPKTGFIEDANKAAINFYGYTKRQLLNKKISEINQLTEEETQEKMRLAVTREKNYFEFKHRIADGTIKDINVFPSVFVANGRELIQSIIIDVTEENKNKSAITESQKRFKAMFEKVNIVKLIIDPKTQNIEQANLAAEKYYGYTIAQLKKMKVNQLNTLSEENTKELIQQDLKNKKGYHEFTHKLASGEIRNVQAFTSIIKIDGEEKAYVSYYDNTEEKRATKKLKDIITAKDKFFSIITHDLRAPFNNIIGFSKLLTSQVREKNYDNIEEFTDIIDKSSLNAINLLENLIEWSKLQSNRITLHPKNINLSEYINSAINVLKYVSQNKNITIEKEVPIEAFIYADDHIVDSLFRNLISNAIKFTNPDGKVTISLEIKPKTYLISIKDNGVGMSEKLINTLFKIGENMSTPGTRKETGTGLGLILCKEFVDKLKGSIYVESELGVGSTFFVELPQFEK